MAAYAGLVRRLAEAGRIDPPAALAGARVYAFTGDGDQVVNGETVRRAVALYQGLGVPETAITLRQGSLPAGHPGHGWITTDFGGVCAAHAPPFLNDCDFDLAGALLQALYGPLSPPVPAREAGLRRFDQRDSPPAARRGGTGWARSASSTSRRAARRLPPPAGCMSRCMAAGRRWRRSARTSSATAVSTVGPRPTASWCSIRRRAW
ncbi:hypothetical protein ACFQU2_02520 [Siccirubricoccus deserti]